MLEEIPNDAQPAEVLAILRRNRERLADCDLPEARDLLEGSTRSIEEIADLAGFGTTGTLRHHFRTQLSTTPAAYREAFGMRARESAVH